jgi:single-strand DNA-binding protein
MNKVVLIGNLTRDPEARATTSGISVCSFTVAVQRRFANQQGERVADFIPIVAWRGLADNCIKYLSKGRKVAVAGMIQTRNYEAQDGTKRYVTEVIADDVQFLDKAASSQGADERTSVPFTDDDIPGFEVIDDNDDLPF